MSSDYDYDYEYDDWYADWYAEAFFTELARLFIEREAIVVDMVDYGDKS